jgi:hypothetical protein
LDEPAKQGRAFLKETTVVRPESAHGVAVDIYLAGNLLLYAYWNNNLRSRLEGTGEISWVGRDVIDDDCLARGDCSPADPFWLQGYARGP